MQSPASFLHPSEYDPIAPFYHRMWRNWYLPEALPALERLFLSRLSPGQRVLDLCCGSGHVSSELIARGLRVYGVDLSAELIKEAKQQFPGEHWFHQDARSFQLPHPVDAALSTFDSLNHILSSAELAQVFQRVHAALADPGLFVFDMNTEEAYRLDLSQWTVQIHDEHVGLVRGQYDPAARLARTELLWFERHNGDARCWQRRDSVVHQRCYPTPEIAQLLSDAGFRNLATIEAREAGMTGILGFGRLFFVAQRGG